MQPHIAKKKKSHVVQLSSVNPPRGTPSAPAQSSLGHSTYWVPAHQGPDGDTRGTFWRKAILGLYCWPWCRIVILDPGKIHDHNTTGSGKGKPPSSQASLGVDLEAPRAERAGPRMLAAPRLCPRTRRHAKQLEFAPTNQ